MITNKSFNKLICFMLLLRMHIILWDAWKYQEERYLNTNKNRQSNESQGNHRFISLDKYKYV